jgi:hypothetical protein
MEWEPCAPNVRPQGIVCRQVKINWTEAPLNKGNVGVEFKRAWVHGSDVTLMIGRWAPEGVYTMFADVDGLVQNAILSIYPGSCPVYPDDVHDGYYVYKVFEGTRGGALAGRLGELRPTFVYESTAFGAENWVYAVGAPGVVRNSASIDLLSWKVPYAPPTPVASPETEGGLKQNYPFFFKDTLFWASDTLPINKQKVWTVQGGAKDFISFGADSSRGAADLGTDGIDMAWVQGSNRSDPNGIFPVVDLMTAPYTTDPALLKPRKIRSISGSPFGTAPVVVGCGFAARRTHLLTGADGGWEAHVMLVRIADGQTWLLPGGPDPSWYYDAPIAITCNEVFLYAHTPTQQIIRIRLDSLGPGSPPN